MKFKNVKLLKTISIFILFSIIVTVPLIEIIVDHKTKTIIVNEEDTSPYEILPGNTISQDIELEGDLKKISILIGNGNRDSNRGEINISISQNSERVTQQFDISNLGDLIYIDLNIDYSKFKKGPAQVTINSEDTKAGESVFLNFKNNANSSDLPVAKINGKDTSGALSLKYITYGKYNDYNYSIIILIGIYICIGLLSYIIGYKKNEKHSIFILTTLIILFANSLKYPMLSFKAEPWAEAGEHFYSIASENSIIRSLFSLEGNMYISAFNAIVSIFAVKMVGISRYYAICIQLISIVFFSICASIFCLDYYKKYCSTITRILFSILIGIFLFNDENITLIQVSYMGIMLIIAFSIYEMENISKIKYTLICAISAIICLSKMTYVILIPLVILALTLFWKRIRVRKKIYLYIILIFAFTEGLMSTILKKIYALDNLWGKMGEITILPLFEFIEKLSYYTVQVFYSVFIRKINVNYSPIMVNIFILSILIIIFSISVFLIYKKNRYSNNAKIILILFFLSVGQCAMALISNAGLDPLANIYWNKNIILYQVRHFMFAYIGIIGILVTIFITVIDYLKKNLIGNKSYLVIKSIEICIVSFLVVVLSVTFGSDYNMNYHEEFTNSKLFVSDWNKYSRFLENDSYCISISPKGWFLKKNSIVETLNKDNKMYSEVKLDSLNEKPIIAIYATKYRYTNQLEDKYYYIMLYDSDNKLLIKQKQINDSYRDNIGFLFDTPIENVDKIKFVDRNGKELLVENELFVARNE